MGATVAVIVFGTLAAAWYLGRTLARAVRPPESRLLRICRGDAAQADRLIEGELGRAPGISRREAAARAIAQHRRDNR